MPGWRSIRRQGSFLTATTTELVLMSKPSPDHHDDNGKGGGHGQVDRRSFVRGGALLGAGVGLGAIGSLSAAVRRAGAVQRPTIFHAVTGAPAPRARR